MKSIKVSKRINDIINVCRNAAESSNMSMKHGAVITKGGNILSSGFNHDRSILKGNKFCSFHAELSAIYRIRNIQRLLHNS